MHIAGLHEGTVDMLFPRKDEVVELHRQMIEKFGGMPGIRDEGLLDSALIAPANRWYYEGAGLGRSQPEIAWSGSWLMDAQTGSHVQVDGGQLAPGRLDGRIAVRPRDQRTRPTKSRRHENPK